MITIGLSIGGALLWLIVVLHALGLLPYQFYPRRWFK